MEIFVYPSAKCKSSPMSPGCERAQRRGVRSWRQREHGKGQWVMMGAEVEEVQAVMGHVEGLLERILRLKNEEQGSVQEGSDSVGNQGSYFPEQQKEGTHSHCPAAVL